MIRTVFNRVTEGRAEAKIQIQQNGLVKNSDTRPHHGKENLKLSSRSGPEKCPHNYGIFTLSPQV